MNNIEINKVGQTVIAILQQEDANAYALIDEIKTFIQPTYCLYQITNWAGVKINRATTRRFYDLNEVYNELNDLQKHLSALEIYEVKEVE